MEKELSVLSYWGTANPTGIIREVGEQPGQSLTPENELLLL